MNPLLIVELVFVIIMFVFCIETFIFFRKNRNKHVGTIRNKLLIRMRIITILAAIIGVLVIINIIINR